MVQVCEGTSTVTSTHPLTSSSSSNNLLAVSRDTISDRDRVDSRLST
jgi:hypothetical protein